MFRSPFHCPLMNRLTSTDLRHFAIARAGRIVRAGDPSPVQKSQRNIARGQKMPIYFKCLSLLVFMVSLISSVQGADDSVRLRENSPEGYHYHVNCRVEVTGSLTLPPEKEKAAAKQLPVRGSSLIDYDERVLSTKAGQVDKTLRIYRQVDFQRRIGDRPQEATIRPEVRRLVVLRLNHVEVPFSPEGPLMWGEIDLVRTDVFTPALTGLLPDGAVRLGDRWKATNSAVQELTDMERIEEGQVECRL